MKTQVNQYKPMPVTTTYGEDYHLTTAHQIRQARKGDESAIKAFRENVAKRAYKQNARYRNLEDKDMHTVSGAYKTTLDFLGIDSKPSYSVTKDMSVQDLVRLSSHLDKIDDMKTNSVRGLRQANARRATALGIEFRTQRELDTVMPKFFELDQKLQEYLRLQESGRLWQYEERHTAIFEYIRNNDIDLSDPSTTIDTIVERMTETINTMNTEPAYTPTNTFDFFD